MNYIENIERIKDYIDSHIESKLTAEELAAMEGYSVFHFCRIFKEYTGEGLMSYVREKRLEAAKKEIEEGKSASAVAEKYGFETTSGFSRAYKRTFGECPTKKEKT